MAIETTHQAILHPVMHAAMLFPAASLGTTAVRGARLFRALTAGQVADRRHAPRQPALPRRSHLRQQRHRPLSTRAVQAGGMEPEVEQIVERIHCTPVRIVLYLGGGASQVR